MIQWATEFPVSPETTTGRFLELAKRWVMGSPHQPWHDYEFGEIKHGEIQTFQKDGQLVSIASVDQSERQWGALRHTWTENSALEWTTEIVGWKAPPSFLVSVRLDCHVLRPGLRTPAAKKPYAIKLLFETAGGGKDDQYLVQDAPHFLAEQDVEEAAAVIEGTTASRLPFVYVSAPFRGPSSVDCRQLARTLSGLAHVVVEPSKYFSFAVARRVAGRNPYGGAVGIFWPRQSGFETRLLPTDHASPFQFEEEIAMRVRRSLSLMRPTTELTWSFVSETVSRQRLDNLKTAGSSEIEEYVEEFDKELKAKTERLQTAEVEISRLKAELAKQSAWANKSTGTLSRGKEKDYYPGELADAIIDAIRFALTNMDENARRHHLLTDFLGANKQSGLPEEFADDIKRCFAARGDLGSDQREVLERLGFTITQDGKHYKAIYHNDDRYTFSISKSSSVHRAGKNLASQINKTLFK